MATRYPEDRNGNPFPPRAAAMSFSVSRFVEKLEEAADSLPLAHSGSSPARMRSDWGLDGPPPADAGAGAGRAQARVQVS